MEKINQHNYEAFFLDYLEGNLAEGQEQELMSFLKDHPNLRLELEDMMEVDLSDLNLSAPDHTLANKAELKREDVEDRMIAAVEGLLSDAEIKALEKEVEEKNLSSTYQYYQHTILKANPATTYSDKEALKQKEARIIPLFYRVASAAAVIILLIGLFFGNWNNEGDQVAEVDSTTVDSTEQILEPKSAVAQVENKTLNTSNEPSIDETTHEEIDQLQNFPVDDRQIAEEKEQKNTPKNIKELKVDSSTTQPSLNLPIKDVKIDEDPIAKNNSEIAPDVIENPDDLADENNDVAINETSSENNPAQNKKEQPFKLFTDAAGNLFNREVFYEREKEGNNEVVAHHFKLGKFEFERKK